MIIQGRSIGDIGNRYFMSDTGSLYAVESIHRYEKMIYTESINSKVFIFLTSAR